MVVSIQEASKTCGRLRSTKVAPERYVFQFVRGLKSRPQTRGVQKGSWNVLVSEHDAQQHVSPKRKERKEDVATNWD